MCLAGGVIKTSAYCVSRRIVFETFMLSFQFVPISRRTSHKTIFISNYSLTTKWRSPSMTDKTIFSKNRTRLLMRMKESTFRDWNGLAYPETSGFGSHPNRSFIFIGTSEVALKEKSPVWAGLIKTLSVNKARCLLPQGLIVKKNQ